jgi:hypothetical protein
MHLFVKCLLLFSAAVLNEGKFIPEHQVQECFSRDRLKSCPAFQYSGVAHTKVLMKNPILIPAIRHASQMMRIQSCRPGLILFDPSRSSRRHQLLQMTSTLSFDPDAHSDQLPASKLVGRWKKVKEVGQDQAMMQVCEFHHRIRSSLD